MGVVISSAEKVAVDILGIIQVRNILLRNSISDSESKIFSNAVSIPWDFPQFERKKNYLNDFRGGEVHVGFSRVS